MDSGYLNRVAWFLGSVDALAAVDFDKRFEGEVSRFIQRSVIGSPLSVRLPATHFKCTAASVCFKPTALPVLTFGIPYFGLISWQPFSQYTPPAADSGVGIGEATATSRSCSISCSTPAISSRFSLGVSHSLTFNRYF